MSPAFDHDLDKKLRTAGIIAVLVIDDAKNAVPLARALLKGGVHAIELTLRTPAAMEALVAIRHEVPEIILGVGTVLTQNQVQAVKKAGADFAVAPGFNPRVVSAAREAGLSFAPGITTASEIELAVEFGCKLLKFFPAEQIGGLSYLRAMAGPYAHLGLSFIPLGGISPLNMSDYLAEPTIAALGGSWLTPRDLIVKQEWEKITALSEDAMRVIHEIRG